MIGTRSLATAGFAVSLPGLASRPVLRHPATVHEALARAATQDEACPLGAGVLPNTADPLPLWGRVKGVESLTTPTGFPPGSCPARRVCALRHNACVVVTCL